MLSLDTIIGQLIRRFTKDPNTSSSTNQNDAKLEHIENTGKFEVDLNTSSQMTFTQSLRKLSSTLPPFEQMPWFHVDLSKEKAEALLSSYEPECFLVRSLGEDTGKVVCSVYLREGFLHLPIKETESHKFVLAEKDSAEYSSKMQVILSSPFLCNLLPVSSATPLNTSAGKQTRKNSAESQKNESSTLQMSLDEKLRIILDEPTLLSIFTMFLQSIRCHELIQFWKDVQGYQRRSNQIWRKNRAKEIYDMYDLSKTPFNPLQIFLTDFELFPTSLQNRYIVPSSPRTINLNSETVQNISNHLNEDDEKGNLFDGAMDEVFEMLKNDSIPKFLKSSMFQAFKKKIESSTISNQKKIQLVEH